MVKSKFNLDTRFEIYDFFYIECFLLVESQFYIYFFTSLHITFTRALHMVMITPIVGGLRASPVRS